MAINEFSLYADLKVETSPVQATAAWTDHIATVRDISLTRGGEEPFVGVFAVQPGSGTISLVDNSATINPGFWVRVRYQTTTIWAGYIQDVITSYGVANGRAYAVKTLVCLDWVAWVAQYYTTGVPAATRYFDRLTDLNNIVDISGANKPIQTRTPVPSADPLFSSLPGERNIAEILDISANSHPGFYWKANLNSPTGSTSGLDDLVDFFNVIGPVISAPAAAVALTDGTNNASPANLFPYTDIEMANKTSQVVNIVNMTNLYGVNDEAKDTSYRLSDATSIGLYGARATEFEVNRAVTNGAASVVNEFPYPSFEDYETEYTDTVGLQTIERPSLDTSGSWNAWEGSWAARGIVQTAAPAMAVPSEGRTPVTATLSYHGFAYGGASNGSSNRGRFYMVWYNEANATISVSYGPYVNFTSLRTWYKCSLTASAPAGAMYVRVGIQHSRSTGANIAVGEKKWTDGLFFGLSDPINWFDGDTADTATNLFTWIDRPNASRSVRSDNYMNTIGTTFLTNNATAKFTPYTIRLNAQANLTAARQFDLYEWVHVWFDSKRWTSTITGITHNITINENGTTRWTIDLTVRPSVNTI